MHEPLEQQSQDGRRALGLGLVIAGLAVIVVFVLMVADAGYGHDPHREFGQRRSYDMVKRDVHSALPRMAPIALLGCLLLFAGARLRRPAADDAAG